MKIVEYGEIEKYLTDHITFWYGGFGVIDDFFDNVIGKTVCI